MEARKKQPNLVIRYRSQTMDKVRFEEVHKCAQKAVSAYDEAKAHTERQEAKLEQWKAAAKEAKADAEKKARELLPWYTRMWLVCTCR